tara:strand:+ start:93 stop:737 length:645 start_codon:yes stop_codon:yes gene_type:complete
MKIPKNHFIVKVEKPYEDTININGKEMFINITYEPLKFARQYGVVKQAPVWLPEGLDFDVKEGDKIYFHHLITANQAGMTIDKKIKSQHSSVDLVSNNKINWIDEDNLYKVHWEHIYARVRDGELKMLHHWNFIEQKKESEEDVKTNSGIYIKSTQDDITLYGYVRHMNSWLEDQGMKEGDEIVFSENSEYDMKIEGKKLLRMRNQDILAKIDG